MFIAIAVLSVLLALAFAGAGFPKLSGKKDMAAQLAQLGVSAGLMRVIGGLEILGAVGLVIGLWIEGLGIAAAAGLALLMAGAVLYHVKARDTAKNTSASLVLLVLSVVTIALRLASL
ncbi:DoxX family protein [Streptosporangium sp. NBC_01755]|uniref:DoxX family protein n=1 Tax=Streptosporangium sp. NBC_01755 TaxID=2975949 RepID=UPI002DDA1D0B|nr:DoxX family protein [Streptosporangium sp. NBC_01755]WSD00222.1 DoxX family protein [Streptosporangium sp. NBC_01755]